MVAAVAAVRVVFDLHFEDREHTACNDTCEVKELLIEKMHILYNII